MPPMPHDAPMLPHAMPPHAMPPHASPPMTCHVAPIMSPDARSRYRYLPLPPPQSGLREGHSGTHTQTESKQTDIQGAHWRGCIHCDRALELATAQATGTSPAGQRRPWTMNGCIIRKHIVQEHEAEEYFAPGRSPVGQYGIQAPGRSNNRCFISLSTRQHDSRLTRSL